jgi:hypothetical protein
MPYVVLKLCPTEEDSGMGVIGDSKCSQVLTGRGEGEVAVQARRQKMGHLILSMEPARAEVCFLMQRATIPSLRLFYTYKSPHMN